MSNNLYLGILIINVFLTSSISSKNGIMVTILSIVTSFAIRLLRCSSGCDTFFAKWMRQISLCCLIGVASLSLSEYLEFYDSGNFAHFIPTVSMPLLLPIMAVSVISVLVFFGLENSDVLNMISAFTVFLSLTLFGFTALFRASWRDWNFQNEFPRRFLNGVILWNSSSSIHDIRKIQFFTTPSIYVAVTVMLYVIPTSGRQVDIISPLGDFYGVYKLLQVPLVSSCLGLALYSFFIPAVASFFDIVAQMKPNEVTAKNDSILYTSITSIVLMYFYNTEDLIILSNSSSMLAELYETGLNLITLYKPSLKIEGLKIKKKYNRVMNDESPIYKESESSSDTDIDDVVEEYQANLKVLTTTERKDPTFFSWILFLLVIAAITILTFLSSYTFENDYFIVSLLTLPAIITLSLILIILPKNKDKPSIKCLKELFVCTTIVFFLRNVFMKMIAPASIWLLTGVALKYKKNRKIFPQKNFSVVQNLSIPLEVMQKRVQTYT